MAKKSSYDDLETDYFDEEVGNSFLSLMSLGVAFLAVAAFIALAWYAYQDDGVEDGELETIYAEEGEIRVEPEGETGWQFPDAERQVYRLGSGQNDDMEVEQILPQPERPAPRPQAKEKAEGWVNKQAVADKPIGLTDAERQKQDHAAPKPTKTAEAKPAPAVEDTKAPAAEKPALTETTTAAKPPAPAKPAPAPSPAPEGVTSHRLQLGAFGSRDEALKNWGKIKAKTGNLLQGKEAYVEVADVKGKTYYRVQAYPFSNKAQADALCVLLKSKNQPCFAVKK